MNEGMNPSGPEESERYRGTVTLERAVIASSQFPFISRHQQDPLFSHAHRALFIISSHIISDWHILPCGSPFGKQSVSRKCMQEEFSPGLKCWMSGCRRGELCCYIISVQSQSVSPLLQSNSEVSFKCQRRARTDMACGVNSSLVKLAS